MSKSAPEAPDYQAAAQEQAQSSREVTEQQTWANRPTINTPFGQQTWEVTPTWDPATGQYINSWTQNTNLTPESQQALEAQQRIQAGRSGLAESLLGRSQQEFGNTMDWSQFTPMSMGPQAQTVGQNLPEFQQAPNTPNYSPEQIQRQLDTGNLQNVDSSQRYSQQANDAIYNQWASRQEPLMKERAEQMRTQLYNQGLKEGDQAFDREMQKLQQGQDDARLQAQYQATIGAGQEAERMYGMDLGLRGQQFNEAAQGGAFANSAAAQALQQQLGIGGQQFQQQMAGAQLGDQRRQQVGQEQMAFGNQNFQQQMQQSNYQNQLRQQQIAEEMQRRGFSLNEINAILTGQQVGMPSMPSFNTAQRSEGVQALNAAQMQGQAALDAFNAEQQALQGMMSGAGSIAGGFMMSDRRLKRNIQQIGWKGDFPVYRFQYLWDDEWHFGVMADEVPESVTTEVAGYKAVNYGRL